MGENTISTHTPHARRDTNPDTNGLVDDISTHTPHARRDQWAASSAYSQGNFYSHASCEA